MTFAVRYEHHGKTAIEIDRKRLIRNIKSSCWRRPIASSTTTTRASSSR